MRRAKVAGLCAFLLVSGCASYTVSFTDDLPLAADGMTTCRGRRPHVEIRNGLSSDWKAVVHAHEIIHVEQMRREKSCAAFISKYKRSAAFRLDTEAEAFCRMPLAVNKQEAIRTIVAILSINYEVPLESVERAVRKYCG